MTEKVTAQGFIHACLVKTDSTGASSSTSGFNWSSIAGYVIIGAVAVIIIGVALFILSRRRK